MKRKVYAVIASVVVGAMAFKTAEDIISRLSLNAGTAQRFIMSNFVGDFDNEIRASTDETDKFRIPYTKMIPSIAAGDKVAAAKDLCEYVRMYCNSNEFVAEYERRRMSALPLSDNGATPATLSRSIVVHQTNINNYKNDKSYVESEQKLMAADQQRLDALLEKAKQPFPLKKEWEDTYPADPALAVKKRLQEYLALVATVDFNAKLAEPDRYKKQKFVNPVYEKKSQKWKAIYRAGKEVNDAVTAYVKDWLKGDILAKEKITMPDAVKKPATANNTSTNAAVTPTADTTASPINAVKEKKSFFNKMKNKAKGVLNY